MAEKATSSSPEEAGACTPEQGKEHQQSSDSLSSAELPQGQVESECPECQLLLRYPQQVTCCQRRFFGEGIEKLLKDGKQCPSCNEADFSTLPDYSDERLGLKSTNKDEGVGELASDLDVDNHINQDCSMTIVDCDYQVFGCKVRPTRKDLPTHITERVADHMAMLAESMREKAKEQAELQNKVSQQQASIDSLQNKKQKMRQHLCWGLTIALAFAAVGIGLASYHGDANLDSRINDTRSEVKDLIVQQASDLSDHRSVFVEYEQSVNKRMSRLEDELEDKLHDVEEDLNTKLEDKDSHIQDSLKSERKKTAESLAQVEKNVNSLKDELEDELGGVKDDLSAKHDDVQDLLASFEVQLQTEMDRKMTDFEKNKTANAEWFSPPFYTHTHGYKMCINVIANGYGDGKGTHVSVYLYLMPGIFDDDLKWPFQGDITIELVNRLNSMSNLPKLVRFSRTSDPKVVARVTSRDRAAIGWGWHKFIAHSELDYNADEQTQYLKHDSLIFRISKVKYDLSVKLEDVQEFAKDMNSLKGKLEDIQKIAERNMNSLTGKLEVVQDSFTSLEVQLQTEIDRKMTDFEKNKTAKAEWFSPPFYTHTHGYKMCINVIANGYGVGKGTHVSVFLVLMPGMFDDDLEWPFQGHITIELVNRLNSTSNLSHVARFSKTSDSASVGKVTSGDRAASGSGRTMFIAHSELDYNADEQTQYLKHDSLIFRISKVTNVK